MCSYTATKVFCGSTTATYHRIPVCAGLGRCLAPIRKGFGQALGDGGFYCQICDKLEAARLVSLYNNDYDLDLTGRRKRNLKCPCKFLFLLFLFAHSQFCTHPPTPPPLLFTHIITHLPLVAAQRLTGMP